MDQFTAEQIQEQFEKLPEEIQRVATSPEIHKLVEDIGKKNGLLIDQIGELVDEIGLVILGLSKADNFVSNISKRLNISSKAAATIAQDVNKAVFGLLRNSMGDPERNEPRLDSQSTIDSQQSTISSLERAGRFSVDKEEETPTIRKDDIMPLDRAQLLESIERTNAAAEPVHHTAEPPQNLPTGTPPPEIEHDDPIIDHVLGNPVAKPEQKVPVQPAETPAQPIKPAVPSKPQGPDPYREAV